MNQLYVNFCGTVFWTLLSDMCEQVLKTPEASFYDPHMGFGFNYLRQHLILAILNNQLKF